MLIDLILGLIHPKGILGHTWDWNIPAYPNQYIHIFLSQLYIWNPSIRGGAQSIFSGELPYWGLLLLLSPLGGERISHLLPLLFVFVSFASMYLFIGRLFTRDRFWIVTGSILYALSPFQYLRIVAGHFTILLGYSVLPVFLYLLISILDRNQVRTRFRYIVYLLLLAVLLGAHFLNIILALILAAVCLSFLPWKKPTLSAAKTFAFGSILFISLFAYWIYPLAVPVLTTGTIRVRQNETIKEEVSRRSAYFDSVSQNISDILTSQVRPGLDTEYVYPIDEIRLLFIPVSLLIAMAAFLSIREARQAPNRRVFRIVYVLCLLGLGLSSGSGNLVGKILYEMLYRFVGPVFAAVSNPLRLLPLFYISMAPLFAYTLSVKSGQMEKRASFGIRVLSLVMLAVYLYPWYLRPMDKPVDPVSSQPISLKINRIAPSDYTVYRRLESDQYGGRVVFMPPAFLSWPGETDHGFSWNSSAYPADSFLEYPDHSLAKLVADDLFGVSSTTGLSKILAFANVKTIIYPQNRYFESYTSYIPKLVNYAPKVRKNWEKQSGILQVSQISPDISVYENADYLPRFYVPEFFYYATGDKTVIRDAVTFSDYRTNSVFFNADSASSGLAGIPYKFDSFTSKAIPSDPMLDEASYKYLLHPSIRFLPDSPLYPYVLWKENRISKSVMADPIAASDVHLLQMGKRLSEFELLVDKKDSDDAMKESILDRYTQLLNLFTNQYRKIGNDSISQNDFLKKMHAIVSRHEIQLHNLIDKGVTDRLLHHILSVKNLVAVTKSELDRRLWADSGPGTKRFFLDIPSRGFYGIYIRNEEFVPQSISIDGITSNRTDNITGQWTHVYSMTLSKGLHRVELAYQDIPNLYMGTSDRSANMISGNQAGDIVIDAGDKQQMICSREMVLSDERKYAISFEYIQSGDPMLLTVEHETEEIVRGQRLHAIDTLLKEKNQLTRYNGEFVPVTGGGRTKICFTVPSADRYMPRYEISDIGIRPVLSPVIVARQDVSGNKTGLPIISQSRLSPTMYRVSVSGASKPFLLVFSENFDHKWIAYVRNNTNTVGITNRIGNFFGIDMVATIPEVRHYQVNTYANAWLVDRKGDYFIDIQFVPQRYYAITLMVSAAALTACIFSIFWMKMRMQTI